MFLLCSRDHWGIIPLTKSEQHIDQPGRDRPVRIVVNPAMVEAGRKAMIDWYEGCDDLTDGALQIFRAMARAGGYKLIEDASQLGIKSPKVRQRHSHRKAL
jgi:hypothetical protein